MCVFFAKKYLITAFIPCCLFRFCHQKSQTRHTFEIEVQSTRYTQDNNIITGKDFLMVCIANLE